MCLNHREAKKAEPSRVVPRKLYFKPEAFKWHFKLRHISLIQICWQEAISTLNTKHLWETFTFPKTWKTNEICNILSKRLLQQYPYWDQLHLSSKSNCKWTVLMIYLFIYLLIHVAQLIARKNTNKQWQSNLSALTSSFTVSHRIGEGPRRSSSQPTPFIIFDKCWEITVGRKNKHS